MSHESGMLPILDDTMARLSLGSHHGKFEMFTFLPFMENILKVLFPLFLCLKRVGINVLCYFLPHYCNKIVDKDNLSMYRFILSCDWREQSTLPWLTWQQELRQWVTLQPPTGSRERWVSPFPSACGRETPICRASLPCWVTARPGVIPGWSWQSIRTFLACCLELHFSISSAGLGYENLVVYKNSATWGRKLVSVSFLTLEFKEVLGLCGLYQLLLHPFRCLKTPCHSSPYCSCFYIY